MHIAAGSYHAPCVSLSCICTTVGERVRAREKNVPKIAPAANDLLKPEKELLNLKIWVAVGVWIKVRRKGLAGNTGEQHHVGLWNKTPA